MSNREVEPRMTSDERKEVTKAVQRHMQAIRDLGTSALDPAAERAAKIFYYWELEDWADKPELKPKDI